MRSSYSQDDVVLLLKDITGLVQPQSTEERERLIQAGRHYCEMLPVEYVPTEKYMAVYQQALEHYSRPVADAVGCLSDKIITYRGTGTVLVSLARAGTPVGILLKHYIRLKYQIDVPHYSISIIRGKGIDDNAMHYLLEKYIPQQLLFVDGWTGKGAIFRELEKAVSAYPGVSPELAVLADPADITELCGTHEDILIPSSCLNSTVSGLISRTFFREDIIGPKDFHGAVYYGELKDADLSYAFIHAIEKNFAMDHAADRLSEYMQKRGEGYVTAECLSEDTQKQREGCVTAECLSEDTQKRREGYATAEQLPEDTQKYAEGSGAAEVEHIARTFEITDRNLIKPGIGETTRVLLRRMPWKILLNERYKGDHELDHIVRLAEEKGVSVRYYPLKHYKCCGIIRRVADA